MHVITMLASPAKSYISSGPPFLSTISSTSAHWNVLVKWNRTESIYTRCCSLPNGNVSDDQFLLVARTFTPKGLSLWQLQRQWLQILGQGPTQYNYRNGYFPMQSRPKKQQCRHHEHTVLPNNVSPTGMPRSLRFTAVSMSFCKVNAQC